MEYLVIRKQKYKQRHGEVIGDFVVTRGGQKPGNSPSFLVEEGREYIDYY